MKATFLCCLLLLCAWTSGLSAEGDASVLFDKGKMAMKSGNYDEAVEAFSGALELLESNEKNAHVVILSRAQAYSGKGDLKNAWKDVNRILESQGVEGETLASVFHVRGMLNRREGRETRALTDFTSAIKTSHQNNSLRAVSFANRGIIYMSMGSLDKAVSDLNKAIELDPKSAFAYAGRGMAYLRQDRVEAALKDSERAMRLNPDKTAEKMARAILDELSVSASGPQSVSVPVSESGHIFVQVRFSKTGKPHRFLLDTGATHSLVNSELLKEIQRETNVQALGKTRVMTADGGAHVVTRYKVTNAFLFAMPLGEIEVHVFDNQARGITNLLGMKSLHNITVSMDGAARRAQLRRKSSFGADE